MSSSSDGKSWESNEYFQSIQKKLFSPVVIDAIAIFVEKNEQDEERPSSVIKTHIRTLSDLSKATQDAASTAWQHTFFIIPQEYSWGRLRITYLAFQKLIHSLSVFVSFLDLVGAFGVKTSDDERVDQAFRSSGPPTPSDEPHTRHEICYNIQYMEKHGRELKDPWSSRQTGIYHQRDGGLTHSKWIMLNPCNAITSRLESMIQTRTCLCDLSVHFELLSSLSANWTAYLEYLNAEWRRYNNKTSYARVEAKEGGYSISYADVQELHALQLKIHRAGKAVQSCLATAEDCQRDVGYHPKSIESEELVGRSLKSGCNQCQKRLDMYSANMSRHADQLQSLNWRLQSTRDLLQQILAFRNGELLHTSYRASCHTLEALFKITEQGRLQQESLTLLLRQGKADSTLLKSLSIVATLCLPASLVAAIFSSNLIQTSEQIAQQQPNTTLVPAPQFWLYFAITLPLMAGTLIWILYLEHRARRVAIVP